MSNMAEDFERLMEPAIEIMQRMEKDVPNAQDAVMVLAMLAAFFINTNRVKGCSLEKAEDAFFSLVSGFAHLGEGNGDDIGLSH